MNSNTIEFLKDYPKIQQILLNSKFLDIIPGGFSIATDVSCKNIIHNPIAAKFLRIEPWKQLSYSSQGPIPLKAYQNGKQLEEKDLPTQRAAWNEEEVTGLEVEFIWEDGVSKIARFSSRPLNDEDGNICGAITTMEDITDIVNMARELEIYKNKLENLVENRSAALKSSEERFSKVFYSSPHAMSINRKSDLAYIEVNNQWLRNSEYRREDVIGKKPLELGIPENEFKSFMKLLNQKGSVLNMESSLIKNNCIAGTVLISAEPIVLNDEECILFASNDITEIKRIQDEMGRLDRLDLVGQMAAGISHEIRNPMTVVRGYLQLLGAKPEFQAHNLTFETMIGEIDRANSIISEFLSLARTKPTEKKCQNINEILQHLYPLLEASALTQDKQIIFEAGKTQEIPLNSKEISQLVLNLCRNGLEAMKERRTLTIRTYTEDEHVVLSIQDEGRGISPEYLDKLGIPFFTTKENGTGLGLAICYSIAERHQAKIDVKSDSSGTTFLLRFPCNLS